MIDRGRRLRRAAVLLLLTVVSMGGCGPAAPTIDAQALGLPSSSTAAVLAVATISTSPDGGIYRNPDHLEVLLVARNNVEAVAAQLGAAASLWSQLRGLGDLTVVAVRLRNDGKVASEPQLKDLQMASDYAPAGTAAGPLRRFYHPTYPLAVAADSQPGDGCSVHLDPGHSGVAILVYPPVNLQRTLVWGRLGDFVLSIPTGGTLPSSLRALHAVACAPAAAPPTPP